MAHRKKPRDYSPALARELVAYMKEHKLPLTKACSSQAHFPSYETAKLWLTLFADFRAIYPRRMWYDDPRYSLPRDTTAAYRRAEAERQQRERLLS